MKEIKNDMHDTFLLSRIDTNIHNGAICFNNHYFLNLIKPITLIQNLDRRKSLNIIIELAFQELPLKNL